MPTIHNCPQGSAEWLKLRLGRVTASELGNIVTPEFSLRTGEMFNKYLYAKIAEAWRGSPLPAFSSWATEQGQLREDEAWAWYALEYDTEIQRVGFVEHDSKRFGCSPDALIGEASGLELKSPESVNHVKYLMDGILPKDYAAQVHGCLYATERATWTFMSYRRGFPAFVLDVKRDEEIIKKIDKSLETFNTRFDEGITKLKSYK